jgi:hypothetical protein
MNRGVQIVDHLRTDGALAQHEADGSAGSGAICGTISTEVSFPGNCSSNISLVHVRSIDGQHSCTPNIPTPMALQRPCGKPNWSATGRGAEG